MQELQSILTNPVFIVLCLLSVYSLALMINHAYYLISEKEDVDGLLDFIVNPKRGKEEIASFASSRNTPQRRLVIAGISLSDRSSETQSTILHEEARALRWESEQRFASLGTIANVAPFIGLFGTVLGVINAFHAIAEKMGAGPSVVASGISEALISTAAGLFVAVPAVIAYNFFLKRARRLGIELDQVAAYLVSRNME